MQSVYRFLKSFEKHQVYKYIKSSTQPVVQLHYDLWITLYANLNELILIICAYFYKETHERLCVHNIKEDWITINESKAKVKVLHKVCMSHNHIKDISTTRLDVTFHHHTLLIRHDHVNFSSRQDWLALLWLYRSVKKESERPKREIL